jgi:hypothetical protein
MNKNAFAGAILGAAMLLPVGAYAQMSSMTNHELASVSGAGYLGGYVISFNGIINYPIPSLSQIDRTYYGINIGQVASSFEASNPELVSTMRQQVLNMVNAQVMPVVNAQLQTDTFLRFFTPITIQYNAPY